VVLKLEITESAIMENFESTTAMLLPQRLGVGSYMDDFSTGYSSLVIYRFPVNM